jgi:hypothetical protein
MSVHDRIDIGAHPVNEQMHADFARDVALSR